MSGILGGVADIAARGFQWWTSELASLAPGLGAGSQLSQGSASAADAIVNLDVKGALHSVIKLKRGQMKRGREVAASDAATGEAGVMAALERLAQLRPGSNVCVRLPYSACYERHVDIPATARRQAASILTLDFERSTPFKLSDVFVSHTLAPSAARKGWLSASQFVVKRKLPENAVRRIEDLGLKVACMDCWTSDGKSSLPLNFLGTTELNGAPSSSHRTMPLMTILALMLAGSAAWIGLSHREAALQNLEEQVSAARGKAEKMQAEQSAADTARSQVNAVWVLKSSRPLAVEIVNELTRLLPDDVTLNDLKIEDGTVDFSGLAKSSAAIIPVLERADMFKDAALTSPVTFDANADKERFSMRLKLRRSSRTASAGAPEGVVQQ